MVKKDSQYTVKWLDDLQMYIPITNSFIIEGNVHDVQPNILKVPESESYIYRPLTETITEMFSEDYCVVLYDRTKQTAQSERPSRGKTSPDSTSEETPKPTDSGKFVSFIFEDNPNQKNVELLNHYWSEEYMKNIEGMRTDSRSGASGSVDTLRIRDIMAGFSEMVKKEEFSGAKPFLFILPDVSRYVNNPRNVSASENAMFMNLYNAAQETESPCRLILMVDKVNDLPTWFESEKFNPSTKKLYIPEPDAEFRIKYYANEMKSVMKEISEDDYPSKVRKFASYTENFTVKRLEQLRKFIKNFKGSTGFENVDDVSAIDRTILLFTAGKTKNAWEDRSMFEAASSLDEINKSILGQANAVSAVSSSLMSSILDVKTSKIDDRRPKAVFMFCGPTGTGKTELSKRMSEKLFGNEDKMIRFDMSEFREDFSDTRLFGAPPGYVGYEAGGELTRAVKQEPCSLILFDEIEKANDRIWDKFLQILGDGRLTDGKGETVSFSQAIIVFTSNLGVTGIGNRKAADAADEKVRQYCSEADRSDMTAFVKGLEKLEETKADIAGLSVAMMGDPLFKDDCLKIYGDLYDTVFPQPVDGFNHFVARHIKEKVRQKFESIGRREIYGRIGDENIIVFNFMTPKIAIGIANNIINAYVKKERVKKGITLTFDEKAKNLIAESAGSPEALDLGGRGITSRVEKMIADALEAFFRESGCEVKTVTVSAEDGELTVTGA